MNHKWLLLTCSVFVASCGGGGGSASDPKPGVTVGTSYTDNSGVVFKMGDDFVRIGDDYAFVGGNNSEVKVSSAKEVDATIVYIFDDGYISHYEKVAPLFENYGIKAGFALIYSFVDRPLRISKSQALDLQNRGFEIVNHSMTHKSLTTEAEDLPTAKTEIETAKDNFEADGIQIRAFVAPYSHTNEKYIGYVKENHYSAYTIYNGQPLEPALWDSSSPIYRLHRLNTELPLSDIKQTIDLVVANSGFLTFYDHDIDGGRTTLSKIEEIITYGINKGAAFNTPTEAARKRNLKSFSYCDLNIDKNTYTCSVSKDLSFESPIEKTALDSVVNGSYGPVTVADGSVSILSNGCLYSGDLTSEENAYFSNVSGDCGDARLYFAKLNEDFYHLLVNSDSVVYDKVAID